MPVFNTGHVVLHAIESVRRQTDPDFELIVVIDASPDDAYMQIASYLHSHPDTRIRVLNKPVNEGVAVARNDGLDLANGHWIAFLDSDDTYEATFLEQLHRVQQHSGADLVTCGHNLRHNSDTVGRRQPQVQGSITSDVALTALITDQLTPFLWDKLFRSSALCNIRFDAKIQRCEDLIFIARCLSNINSITTTSDYLYNYSVGNPGLTWGRAVGVEEVQGAVVALQAAIRDFPGQVDHSALLAASDLLVYVNSIQTSISRVHRRQFASDTATLRQSLPWRSILSAARLLPTYTVAATLLKLVPTIYHPLYLRYINKTYQIAH